MVISQQRFSRSPPNLALWCTLAVSSLLAPNFPQFQNQDGGGRRLEKWKDDHISATVWPIGAKFGMETHFGGLKPCHA